MPVINERTNRAVYDCLILHLDSILKGCCGKIRLIHLLPVPAGGKPTHPGMNIEITFHTYHALEAFLKSAPFQSVRAEAPACILDRAYVLNENRFNCSQVMLYRAV